MKAALEKPNSGAFIDGIHYFALRVYIEDTDLGGVVYHANYLRFLERARSDMLRTLGINQRAALERGDGVYAVADVQIKYCKPARLDDELVVSSQLQELGGASCLVRQEIFRGPEIIAQATVKAAFLGPNGRPKRQPPEWVQKFRAALEGAENRGVPQAKSANYGGSAAK